MDSMNWGDGIASRRTFGGCHSIHLSYGRDALILQEYPHDGVIVWTVTWGEECWCWNPTRRKALNLLEEGLALG